MSNPLLIDLIDNVRSSIDRTSVDYATWLCNNFQNPKRPQEPWSFKDHEFQVEIASAGDDVHTLDAQKCAQVGLSTIEILSLLAFAALHDSLKAAYVLPTAKFAQDFVQLRFDPIIRQSPRISSLLSNANDNKSMKQVGTCHLVFKGTSGESQAISVDLDMLMVDEVNFCNAKVLSSFSSRLQHSDLRLFRRFSTPTLPGFGISLLAKEGSMGRYLVKCLHCGHWCAPSFFRDLRGRNLQAFLARFEKSATDIRPADISHLQDWFREAPGGNDAHLVCEHCQRNLEASLRDASRRQWVHESPTKFKEGHRSYYVKPFDLPKYNATPEVLLSMKDYTYGDFVNFRLGEEHESAENSFLVNLIKSYCTVPPTPIGNILAGASGHAPGTLYIGSDLGKTNHVAIGREGASGQLEVICFCTVDVAQLREMFGEANFGKWLAKVFLGGKARRMVLDSAPSYEPALFCYGQLPLDCSFGAYYVQRGVGKPDIYDFKSGQGVVNICRTEAFDELAAALNSGGLLLPSDSEKLGVLDHLGNFKKVKTMDSKGGTRESWQDVGGPDHYAHALLYLWAAYTSMVNRRKASNVLAFPSVGKAKMK